MQIIIAAVSLAFIWHKPRILSVLFIKINKKKRRIVKAKIIKYIINGVKLRNLTQLTKNDI